MHIPLDTEVETYSGQYVDLKDPRPETIVLEDIAHALSQICRYNGHTRRFDSVAEHAVMVSQRLERKGLSTRTQLGGLHHDDAEAYLGDVVRPLKALLGDLYTEMSDHMDEVIATALGLPEIDDVGHAAIKDADNWAIFVEARHFLPSGGEGWNLKSFYVDAGIPKRIVTPDYFKGGIKPAKARLSYLKRHSELVARLKGDGE